VAEPGPPVERSRISRWLSRADRYASRPLAAVLVIGGAGVWILVSIAVGFPARWETIFQTLVAALTSRWSLSSSTSRPVISERRSANSTRSFWPCPVPTTPCSRSSTLPMKSCAPLDTSIGRSVKPRSMTIPGPAQTAQRKQIRLSALRDTGPNRPAHYPRIARPGPIARPSALASSPG
jgi:hypothetical protein